MPRNVAYLSPNTNQASDRYYAEQQQRAFYSQSASNANDAANNYAYSYYGAPYASGYSAQYSSNADASPAAAPNQPSYAYETSPYAYYAYGAAYPRAAAYAPYAAAPYAAPYAGQYQYPYYPQAAYQPQYQAQYPQAYQPQYQAQYPQYQPQYGYAAAAAPYYYNAYNAPYYAAPYAAAPYAAAPYAAPYAGQYQYPYYPQQQYQQQYGYAPYAPYAPAPYYNAPYQPEAQYATYTPSVDIYDNKKSVEIYCDMPGCREDDIEVYYNAGQLSISARSCAYYYNGAQAANQKSEGQYVLVERTPYQYQRYVPIEADIDMVKIKSSYDNGVLTVSLPKTKESANASRRIAVTSAE